MLQERRRTVTFFGLGGAIVLMVGAGLVLKAPNESTGTQAPIRTAKTFQAMERPDPVLLLTPVRLPDRMSATR